MQTRFFTQGGVWMKKMTIVSSKMMSSTETNVTPKRLKIEKFRLQILVDSLKSYLKRTYFFKIEEKMVLQSRVKFTNNHFSAPSKMMSSSEIDVTPKRL